MLHRFYIVPACSQAFRLRLYLRWDLTCHWTLSALCYDIRLGIIAELYRTYETVYMGFAITCFDALCSQSGPLLVSLLVQGSTSYEWFTIYIGILEYVLF